MSDENNTNNTTDMSEEVNFIKDELSKFPLDIDEKEYINTNLIPLLNVLYDLSSTSQYLSASVKVLTNSPIVKPKRSEIRDTIHLIYNINDECEDVYDLIKKRLKILFK